MSFKLVEHVSFNCFLTISNQIAFLQSEVTILAASLPRTMKQFTSWYGEGFYEEMTHLWKEYKCRSSMSRNQILALQIMTCLMTFRDRDDVHRIVVSASLLQLKALDR